MHTRLGIHSVHTIDLSEVAIVTGHVNHGFRFLWHTVKPGYEGKQGIDLKVVADGKLIDGGGAIT